MRPRAAVRRARLVIFVKEPHPGRVKTRLGRDIGMVNAAWWYRHQSRRVLRRLGGDLRWDVWLAVSPDREGMQSRVWPAHLPRITQGGGDVGQRMAAVFRAMPPGPVLIVGTDIPGVIKGHITEAFSVLGGCDAVFGPATDGGYWLVGLKRSRPGPPGLFRNVRWSSAHALADSVAGMGDMRIGYASKLDDVDDISDLRRAARAKRQAQSSNTSERDI